MESPYKIGYLAGYSGKSESAAAEALYEAEELGILTIDGKAAEACLSGYEDGRKAGLVARGVKRYTTAPDAYDHSETFTTKIVGTFEGRKVRQVVIQPAQLEWQTSRYSSGLHPCWTDDQFKAEVQSMSNFRRAA